MSTDSESQIISKLESIINSINMLNMNITNIHNSLSLLVNLELLQQINSSSNTRIRNNVRTNRTNTPSNLLSNIFGNMNSRTPNNYTGDPFYNSPINTNPYSYANANGTTESLLSRINSLGSRNIPIPIPTTGTSTSPLTSNSASASPLSSNSTSASPLSSTSTSASPLSSTSTSASSLTSNSASASPLSSTRASTTSYGSNESLNNIFSNLFSDRNLNNLESMEISVMGIQPPPLTRTNQHRVVSHHNIFSNTKVYSKKYNENESKDNCSICLAPIENNEIVREINKCKHILHINCADKWFEENITCPICRQDIRVEITQ